jgi:uncharacterized protein YyaL (SSP411 family)
MSCFIFSISCNQKSDSSAKDYTALANELVNETSPYLLQHAYNPVRWKAWNNKALEQAKKDNKLIVISVGYSACHWCHVMEEESFENDSVAKLMNERFINIKVDREERPDIDQIYVNAVTLMTGSAGWPLNVIALPDGRPVFGGTYFTKNQWLNVLEQTSTLYDEDPQTVISYAEKLTQGMKQADLVAVNKEKTVFETEQLTPIVDSLKTSLDFELGGLKNAPKFPMPSHLSFLLNYAHQYKDAQILDYVTHTLDKMANGGLYDQIGGGFSRYVVDDRWHVPHFEKMLYDNAQLVSVYAQAYKLTKNKSYKRVVTETLSFISNEMTSKEGAFFSSFDADSKNEDNALEEGVYYTWTKEKLQSILNEDYELFEAYYNINSTGLWEKGRYILYKTQSDNEFITSKAITNKELQSKLKDWKQLLIHERNKREKPRMDDKVLTSWNALMIKAYLDAYTALDNNAYLEAALKNAEFIKDQQYQPNGQLFHSYKDGKSTIEGFAEDYAHVINAYIELYQSTLDRSWLDLAKTQMDYSIAHFMDDTNSMFYFTSDNAANLITRKTEIFDNVLPASNAVQAHNLFILGHYYYDKSYSSQAKQMLTNIHNDILNAPTAFTHWLELYLNYSNPFYEVAISGPDAPSKLKALNKTYTPNIIIAGATKEDSLPLLANKFLEDNTLIYVCVNGTCKMPVIEVDKALGQITKPQN